MKKQFGKDEIVKNKNKDLLIAYDLCQDRYQIRFVSRFVCKICVKIAVNDLLKDFTTINAKIINPISNT